MYTADQSIVVQDTQEETSQPEAGTEETQITTGGK